MLDQDRYVYDAESGRYVSDKQRRVATIIQDYDPDMFLVWIPPEDRGNFDVTPYAVVHKQPDGRMIEVFRCAEDEVDERLLARIFAGDTRKQDVFGRLEAQEAAAAIYAAKKKEDEIEERAEFAKFVLESNQTVKHNGVTYQ